MQPCVFIITMLAYLSNTHASCVRSERCCLIYLLISTLRSCSIRESRPQHVDMRRLHLEFECFALIHKRKQARSTLTTLSHEKLWDLIYQHTKTRKSAEFIRPQNPKHIAPLERCISHPLQMISSEESRITC